VLDIYFDCMAPQVSPSECNYTKLPSRTVISFPKSLVQEDSYMPSVRFTGSVTKLVVEGKLVKKKKKNSFQYWIVRHSRAYSTVCPMATQADLTFLVQNEVKEGGKTRETM
jgi:hypothetical protein